MYDAFSALVVEFRTLIVVVLCAAGLVFGLAAVWLVPLRLWVRTTRAGLAVGLPTLIGWRFNGLPVADLVDTAITAREHRLLVRIDDLLAHHEAGGDFDNAVTLMIEAKRAGQALTWRQACATDLAEVLGRAHPRAGT